MDGRRARLHHPGKSGAPGIASGRDIVFTPIPKGSLFVSRFTGSAERDRTRPSTTNPPNNVASCRTVETLRRFANNAPWEATIAGRVDDPTAARSRETPIDEQRSACTRLQLRTYTGLHPSLPKAFEATYDGGEHRQKVEP